MQEEEEEEEEREEQNRACMPRRSFSGIVVTTLSQGGRDEGHRRRYAQSDRICNRIRDERI